jgi:hypothetical protein
MKKEWDQRDKYMKERTTCRPFEKRLETLVTQDVIRQWLDEEGTREQHCNTLHCQYHQQQQDDKRIRNKLSPNRGTRKKDMNERTRLSYMVSCHESWHDVWQPFVRCSFPPASKMFINVILWVRERESLSSSYCEETRKSLVSSRHHLIFMSVRTRQLKELTSLDSNNTPPKSCIIEEKVPCQAGELLWWTFFLSEFSRPFMLEF